MGPSAAYEPASRTRRKSPGSRSARQTDELFERAVAGDEQEVGSIRLRQKISEPSVTESMDRPQLSIVAHRRRTVDVTIVGGKNSPTGSLGMRVGNRGDFPRTLRAEVTELDEDRLRRFMQVP